MGIKYSKYKDMLIKTDLPIFFTKNRIDNIDKYFESLGIVTLQDLFEAYDRGKFNDNRFKFNKEIKGQTKLLKYYYEGTTFGTIELLDKKIPMCDTESLNEWFFRQGLTEALNMIGMTEWEQHMLHNYCYAHRTKYEKREVSIIYMMNEMKNDKVYLKNLMSHLSSEEEYKTLRNLLFKIGFYKTYKRDQKLVKQGTISDDVLNTIADVESMDNLEEQLELLKEIKKSIDRQIDLAEKQKKNITTAVDIRKERNKVFVKK